MDGNAAIMTNRSEQDILNQSFDFKNNILQTLGVQIDQITGLPVQLSTKVNGGLVSLIAEYTGTGTSKVLVYLGILVKGTTSGRILKFTYDADYDFTGMTSANGAWANRASLVYT